MNRSGTPPDKKEKEEERGTPPKSLCCPLKLQHSPQDRQTLGPNILAAMLDPRYEVGHKLLNGAFILDGARDTLCDLHLIPLTAWRRVERLSPEVQGSEDPTPPLQGTVRKDTTQEDPHSSRSHILGNSRDKVASRSSIPGSGQVRLHLPLMRVCKFLKLGY